MGAQRAPIIESVEALISAVDNEDMALGTASRAPWYLHITQERHDAEPSGEYTCGCRTNQECDKRNRACGLTA